MSFTRRSFFAFVAGIPAALRAAFSGPTGALPVLPTSESGPYLRSLKTCLITVIGLPCTDATIGHICRRFPGMSVFDDGFIPAFQTDAQPFIDAPTGYDSLPVKITLSSLLLYRDLDALVGPDAVDEVWEYSPAGFIRQPDQRPLNEFNWGGCGRKLFDPEKLYWSKAADGTVTVHSHSRTA